jgi:hypothetical protein
LTRLTIADIVATSVALAAGIILAAVPEPAGPRGGAVVIKSLSDSTRVVDLWSDSTVVIRGVLGETTILVGEGGVEFASSPCPHKVCVERGRIGARGEWIVCVPNGVSARIVGEEGFDAIVP